MMSIPGLSVDVGRRGTAARLSWLIYRFLALSVHFVAAAARQLARK